MDSEAAAQRPTALSVAVSTTATDTALAPHRLSAPGGRTTGALHAMAPNTCRSLNRVEQALVICARIARGDEELGAQDGDDGVDRRLWRHVHGVCHATRVYAAAAERHGVDDHDAAHRRRALLQRDGLMHEVAQLAQLAVAHSAVHDEGLMRGV